MVAILEYISMDLNGVHLFLYHTNEICQPAKCVSLINESIALWKNNGSL